MAVDNEVRSSLLKRTPCARLWQRLRNRQSPRLPAHKLVINAPEFAQFVRSCPSSRAMPRAPRAIGCQTTGRSWHGLLRDGRPPAAAGRAYPPPMRPSNKAVLPIHRTVSRSRSLIGNLSTNPSSRQARSGEQIHEPAMADPLRREVGRSLPARPLKATRPQRPSAVPTASRTPGQRSVLLACSLGGNRGT
ncbi:MAG: hypothetical protein RIS70_3208 [Planctomycetota bacterium]